MKNISHENPIQPAESGRLKNGVPAAGGIRTTRADADYPAARVIVYFMLSGGALGSIVLLAYSMLYEIIILRRIADYQVAIGKMGLPERRNR